MSKIPTVNYKDSAPKKISLPKKIQRKLPKSHSAPNGWDKTKANSEKESRIGGYHSDGTESARLAGQTRLQTPGAKRGIVKSSSDGSGIEKLQYANRGQPVQNGRTLRAPSSGTIRAGANDGQNRPRTKSQPGIGVKSPPGQPGQNGGRSGISRLPQNHTRSRSQPEYTIGIAKPQVRNGGVSKFAPQQSNVIKAPNIMKKIASRQNANNQTGSTRNIAHNPEKMSQTQNKSPTFDQKASNDDRKENDGKKGLGEVKEKENKTKTKVKKIEEAEEEEDETGGFVVPPGCGSLQPRTGSKSSLLRDQVIQEEDVGRHGDVNKGR